MITLVITTIKNIGLIKIFQQDLENTRTKYSNKKRNKQ